MIGSGNTLADGKSPLQTDSLKHREGGARSRLSFATPVSHILYQRRSTGTPSPATIPVHFTAFTARTAINIDTRSTCALTTSTILLRSGLGISYWLEE
jgi:hypothetical protein